MVAFFDHPFFIVVGGLVTLASVIVALAIVVSWVFGVGPVLWRLGIARWKRRICIVADTEHYSMLEKDLLSSGIFRKKNIDPISESTIDQIRDYSLILVHYKSFSEANLRKIFERKNSKSGMIVYFPEYSPEKGDQIPHDMLNEIVSREFTTVVNHRGRLINDLFTTLVTTSYG